MSSETENSPSALRYPWGTQNAIAEGQPVEVARGVYWATFRMPAGLDHINLWLLEDGDGWTVVDTGLDLPQSRVRWEGLFTGLLGGRRIRRVICTHLHPDHTGLAGWLCERFGAELFMTRQEFLMCRTLIDESRKPASRSVLEFCRAAGYTEDDIADYAKRFGSFGSVIHALPDQYRRLVDRETLGIGENLWQIVVGSGHTPEHACLHCPALKLLISGDQILPNISSNISVMPLEPYGDPLSDWLDSCRRLRSVLPPDSLVLPAHGTPFYGLAPRLTRLIESHQRDLDSLWRFLDSPKRVVDCFTVLFKRKIGRDHLGMATGETLAHLNHLIGLQRVRRDCDANGVNWYSRVA